MPRERKVWGWTWYRNGIQTREVMAAVSQAECMRTAGLNRGQFKHSASITGNPDDIAIAMSKPGTVFYCDIRIVRSKPEWHELETTDEQAKGSTS